MRRAVITILLLLVVPAAFWAAGRLNGELLEMRRAARLSPADPLENTPPLVAFSTVALGGFRGILVDILWMRAAELQDQGRYFELVQLADWITKLQPRYDSIWVYHAWNLAFNVSVLLSNPEDRWRWVQHGVRLLRDEGLKYNPGSADIRRELAWLFAFKIGGDLDSAHWTYKRHYAEAMTAALGGAHPDWDALAAAPRAPDALAAAPGLAALLDALRKDGADPFDPRLLEPDGAPPAARARLESDPAAPALLAFLRARRLREVERLEPEALRRVDAEYGPFDWRLPQAQAVYWADQGLAHARPGFEDLALRRAIYQGVADAALRGRLWSDPARGWFSLAPNLDLIPRALAVHEQALKDFPGTESIQDSHRNFLMEAVMICAQYNRQKQAGELFAELKRRYPDAAPEADLEAFVYRLFTERADFMSPEQAQASVEAALVQSAFWEALGDADQAAGFARMARWIYDRYQASRARQADWQLRTGLRPFDELVGEARQRAIEATRNFRGRGGVAP